MSPTFIDLLKQRGKEQPSLNDEFVLSENGAIESRSLFGSFAKPGDVYLVTYILDSKRYGPQCFMKAINGEGEIVVLNNFDWFDECQSVGKER